MGVKKAESGYGKPNAGFRNLALPVSIVQARRIDWQTEWVHSPRMNAFETAGVIGDSSHLSLREPVPRAVSRECRVIVLFEPETGAGNSWPDGFFEAIRIEDAAFTRPPQGNAPDIRPLDA